MPTNPMEYIWPGIIAAQAIHVAAKLRIPDLLASGPKTIAELASDSGSHPAALERLLRALSTLELFAATPDRRFRNTPLSEVLRTDYPQSQRDGALFLPARFLWLPIGELYQSVRTGDPGFQRIFGQPFFEYLAAHPADAAIFNKHQILEPRIGTKGIKDCLYTEGLLPDIYLRLEDEDEAEDNLNELVKLAGKLYDYDNDADDPTDPTQAFKGMWPSSSLWRLCVAVAMVMGYYLSGRRLLAYACGSAVFLADNGGRQVSRTQILRTLFSLRQLRHGWLNDSQTAHR